MEPTSESIRIPENSDTDEEMQLRKRLFELDSAMDALRRDPGAASQIGILAEERDAIRVRLQAFDPPDAELGYQRNDEPFSKVDHDGRFIASPSETGGGGGFA
jgi:hypothetical protein